MTEKTKKKGKGRRIVLPPPTWSARLYVRLAQPEARHFRYLLEAYDNLAYTSVVDRKACIFKLTFSPHQEAELRAALADMRQSLEFAIIEAPLDLG